MRTRARFERAHCSVDPLKLQAPAGGTKQAFLYNDGASRAPHRHYKSPCGDTKWMFCIIWAGLKTTQPRAPNAHGCDG